MAERYKINSVSRDLKHPEVLSPVRDEVIREFGERALTGFPDENMCVHLAIKRQLKQIPAQRATDMTTYRQQVESLMPESFSDDLPRIPVDSLGVISAGKHGILFAFLRPTIELTEEHAALNALLRLHHVPTRINDDFLYQVGLGVVRRRLPQEFVSELGDLAPNDLDLRRGRAQITITSEVE